MCVPVNVSTQASATESLSAEKQDTCNKEMELDRVELHCNEQEK